MAFPSTSRVLVGDVQNNNQIWKRSLQARQEFVEQQIENVKEHVRHSPIVPKREVTGRRLDKERVYNPITCTFEIANASRKDLSPKPEGRKTYGSQSSSSIAGETPSWFSGTRRMFCHTHLSLQMLLLTTRF